MLWLPPLDAAQCETEVRSHGERGAWQWCDDEIVSKQAPDCHTFPHS